MSGVLTTSPSTSVLTRSPISGEISDPNCCRVVRNRFSLLSCLAPHAGGNCCEDAGAGGGDGVCAFILDGGDREPFNIDKEPPKNIL